MDWFEKIFEIDEEDQIRKIDHELKQLYSHKRRTNEEFFCV